MSATTQSIFSGEQSRALAAVLDEILPPSADGRLPGAGALGVVAHLEAMVEKNPDLLPAISEGLAKLDEAVRGCGCASLAELARDARRAVLNELAGSAPTFLPALVFHTYVGYYEHPQVMEALGLEARPPHPKGYELEPGDASLLDPVRVRPPMYREV